MFKGKISESNRGLLLELLKLMAEADGVVSQEEMEMILQIKKMYRIKKYKYRNLTKEDIYLELKQLDDKTILNILSHAAILALEDRKFDSRERSIFLDFFSLLSLESAAKLQHFITMYGKEDFDFREFYDNNKSNDNIQEDSLEIMNEFSNADVEDIDESKLMRMKKGPLKKNWHHVLRLYDIVRSPKSDKVVKSIAIGALLYVIFPLDAISDLIPVLGLTDDVAVVSYALSQIAKRKKSI